jgi:hypothetical protein
VRNNQGERIKAGRDGKSQLVGILSLVTIKDMEKKDVIRQVYEALPKVNCGFCGFGNCGQFARAVAEGRASPFGCQQNPWSGYRISRIIGVRLPAYSYQFEHAFVPKAGLPPWPKALREELRRLSQTADDILLRITKLKEETLARET